MCPQSLDRTTGQFAPVLSHSDIGHGRRLLTFALLALAICAPPLLLIPLEIHAGNPYEFAVSILDLLPVLLTGALISAALITLGALILPRKADTLTTAALLALAVLVWIQGQLIVPDYGVLDGGEAAWSGQRWRIMLDLLLWIGIPVVILTARLRLRAWAAVIALALLAIQGLPAARAVFSQPAVPEFHRYFFDDSQQFTYSADQNVVIIVLDAFQADIFGQLLADDPDLAQTLSGFTWFRNALAGYSKTYPSFALMLSGRWYDNDEPIQAFIKQSFMEQSLPRELLNRGWQVELLPWLKRIVYPAPGIASNVRSVFSCSDRMADAGKSMDIGLFRVSPQWWKGWWINDYRWRLGLHSSVLCPAEEISDGSEQSRQSDHHAIEFLDRAEQELASDHSRPVFHLYHLMMPHAPFLLDESLSEQRLPTDESGFRRHSRATLTVLERFLELLRLNGLYDNTVIAVVSDHGGGEYTETIDTSTLSTGDNWASDTQIPGEHHASGLPLVLIKPAVAGGPLALNDAPVSLGDLAATISAQLGLNEQFPGRDMFDLEPDTRRSRSYRFYSFDGWSGEYLPDMIEYRIDGHSWLAGSWTATGRSLTPGTLSRAMIAYRPGDRLAFRPGQPSEAYLRRGWSSPETNGMVWSRDSEAIIQLPLVSAPADGLLLRLDYLPYTGGGAIPSPRIRLNVNGELHQEWRSTERGWHELRIPASVIRERQMIQLQFEFPDAAVPAELGTSTDSRRLGMALYHLELRPVEDDD